MSQFCEEVSFTGALQFETDRNVGGKGKASQCR
jgi:hypothetical protein